MITCIVSIAIKCLGEIYCITPVELTGKILSTYPTKYIVDFSESAKTHTVLDYSKVIIDKQECKE